ncbi:MAG: hypothetical protein H0T54_04780 [Geodermatophilaceae bacterium]|nr:hypothetical protein [Geodermatophilaceae bacterium]
MDSHQKRSLRVSNQPTRGLSLVLAATIVVSAIGVVESIQGLTTVVSTAGVLLVPLVLLSVTAVAMRVTSARTTRRWPRRAMGGLAASSALLLVIMLVATFRAHTASTRFEDQSGQLPAPRSIRISSGRQQLSALLRA